jgi:hypothetical protein
MECGSLIENNFLYSGGSGGLSPVPIKDSYTNNPFHTTVLNSDYGYVLENNGNFVSDAEVIEDTFLPNNAYEVTINNFKGEPFYFF